MRETQTPALVHAQRPEPNLNLLLEQLADANTSLSMLRRSTIALIDHANDDQRDIGQIQQASREAQMALANSMRHLSSAENEARARRSDFISMTEAINAAV